MNFIKEKNRIYSINSEGQVIDEIVFVEEKKGVFNIRHTFVDKSLRGQGIASKLVEEAVKEIKRQSGSIEASCSYAKKWLEKNDINNL